MMSKLENVNEMKKLLMMNVFDGFCDDDLGSDFNSNFDKIVGFKEDVENWGEGYFVCVDKDNNILFDWVSVSDKNDERCCNIGNDLFFNIKDF